MTVLRQTTTKKGKARYWVDFVSDRRHQRKFQVFENACEYLYLNWFCYKINNRSVNDDAVFDGVTFKEMLHVFYGYQQHRYAHNEISYNTLNRYKSLLSINLNCKLFDITSSHFHDVSDSMKVCLKAFFEWFKYHELIKINPVKVRKSVKKLPYIAKQDDIAKINANSKLSDQDKLLIFVAQHTGARISEIVTLKMTDITDRTISFISHEVRGVEKLQTKSGVGRTIRVHPSIIEKIKSCYVPNKNTYVFWNSRRNKRITENAFRMRFSKVGFTKFHSLRHRAASEWIVKGVNTMTLSKSLGHHSISYTYKKYAHLIHTQDELPII